jgi:hypothetical protein
MRSDRGFGGWALLAGGTALTTLFLLRFRPAVWIFRETAGPVAAAIVILLAVLAAGSLAASAAGLLMGVPCRTRSLSDLLLIGFPALGTVAGAIALLTTATVRPLVLLLALFGIVTLVRDLRAFATSDPDDAVIPETGDVEIAYSDSNSTGTPREVEGSSGPVRRIGMLALLALPILLGAVEALTPANSPDELIYKLAIPHQYLLSGRMVDLPLNSNSYLAMAMQLTDMAGLELSGSIAAKLARFALFLATLFVIHRLARRLAGSGAWVITALIAWTPALMLIAGWAWNEWGVLGLLVLSFERWERWLDKSQGGDAALSFAALGGAIASKYTALPWLLAFAVVAVWRCRDRRVLLRGALVVALFGGFFYLRNVVWTGSPIAPLLLRDAPKVTNYRSGGALSGFTDLVRGYDVVDPAIIDESLGILLPLAAVCGLFLWYRRERITRDLVAHGALQMPVLLAIAPGSRNMLNGVVPLAMAGGVVMVGIWYHASRTLRALLACAGLIALTSQLVLVGYSAGWEDWTPYLTGRESASAYIGRTRSFSRPYAWIGSNTPSDALILVLGENRTFYLDRRAIAAGNLDSPRIASWLSHFSDPQAFDRELHRLGVAYVLLGRERYRIGDAPLGMLEKEFVLQVPAQVDSMLMTFLRQRTTLRYDDRRYAVFQLRPEYTIPTQSKE